VGPRTDATDEGGDQGSEVVAGRALETMMGGGDAATSLSSARPSAIEAYCSVEAEEPHRVVECSVVASSAAIAIAQRRVVASPNAIAIAPCTTRVHVQEEMVHDSRIIDGLYQMIVAFPPPWNTMTLLEAAVLRFPDVERIALRMTVAAIVIALRRGANDILFASLRRGPRRDEYGELLVDLDLKEINKFNSST